MNTSSDVSPRLTISPQRSRDLAELVQQAMAYGLISQCRISPTVVHLYKDNTVVLEAAPAKALAYVQGLLHGYRQALRMTETIPEALLMEAMSRFAA